MINGMTSAASSGATHGRKTNLTGTGLEDYEAFVASLGERDRRNVRRHVALCEAEPTADHATLWKRLACLLAGLTDRAARTTGIRAVQFFSTDGNYQTQVFALEEPRDGTLIVYAPDALEAAEAAGVIRGPVRSAGDSHLYEVGGVHGLNIAVEVLSASKTVDAPDYYRHLLGWNRRALKITLRTSAGRAQVNACVALCRLAAGRFSEPAGAMNVGGDTRVTPPGRRSAR